jgi:hypothetical protein
VSILLARETEQAPKWADARNRTASAARVQAISARVKKFHKHPSIFMQFENLIGRMKIKLSQFD